MKPVEIVVVEDEWLIASSVEETLTEGGFFVSTFASGDRACAYLATLSDPPACVVTDIRMPGTTGWDVARFSRGRFPEIAVLYTSGHAAGDWTAQGLPKTVFLQKPFASAQLVAAVTDAIAMMA